MSRASFPEPRNSLLLTEYATHDTRQRYQCFSIFYRPTCVHTQAHESLRTFVKIFYEYIMCVSLVLLRDSTITVVLVKLETDLHRFAKIFERLWNLLWIYYMRFVSILARLDYHDCIGKVWNQSTYTGSWKSSNVCGDLLWIYYACFISIVTRLGYHDYIRKVWKQSEYIYVEAWGYPV